MTFAIIFLLLVCLAVAALLTLTPRPFEIGAVAAALACGGIASLLSNDFFLSLCAGALTLCALLTFRTIIETFDALHVRRTRAVNPGGAARQSVRGSKDERSHLAA